MQPPAKTDAPPAWKPLVICPNAPLAQRILVSLSDQGILDGFGVSQYPQAGEIASLAARHGSDICFLDVGSTPERALQLISEIAPSVPVVALNPGNDADLILRCLRLGASEFLPDASTEQVAAVLDRLQRLQAKQEPRKSGSVYGVMPGKPGCGASTLAAHLALDLKRCGASKVLLVDTDMVTGSIAFLLKLKSEFHLGDAIRDCQRLDQDLWARMVVPCQGVDVLLAPENAATRVSVEQQVAFELAHFWRTHYEAVILDLPGPYSPGLEFAGIADEILLVTTSEVAAVHTSRRTLDCLDRLSADRSRTKLVISRYGTASGLKREDLQSVLRLEPYCFLSNDYEVVQSALVDGRPVPPDSHLGRSIRALAERLSGKQKPVKKKSSLLSLLARK